MKRREFISLIGGAAIAWPRLARAQQPGTPVIGFLGTATPDTSTLELEGFRRGLSEGGYAEGRNLIIEYRWAEGQGRRLRILADDLVHRNVDAIVVTGNSAALAAKAASATIPVVGQVGNDPVAAGLVQTLARPGGNVTGVATLSAEVVGKRVELLHEVVPAAFHVGLLINPTNRDSENAKRAAEKAAQELGIQLNVLRASSAEEIETAFAGLKQIQIGAIAIAPDAFFNSRAEQLATLGLRYSVPSIYQYRKFAIAGGLISYGADIADAYRLVGVYTARILKGEKPAVLPMQQVSKIQLFINLKTANVLHLDFPRSVIAEADEVIE